MSQQHTPFQKGAKLDKTKLRREKVFLGPEHGPGVYIMVRGQSVQEAREFDELKAGLADASKPESERKDIADLVIAMCVVNDDGTQKFDDAQDAHDNFDISQDDFFKIVEVTSKLSGADRAKSKNQ